MLRDIGLDWHLGWMRMLTVMMEGGGRRDKIGKGLRVQTSEYKINKIEGCNVQHREYRQCFTITLYNL